MKRLIICVALLCGMFQYAAACTNLIVGKKASADGSVIVSYAADSYGMFGTLYHSPAGFHQPGEMVDIVNWDSGKYLGKIPQVAQTYNVIGNINEFQLTIAETTFGGREELRDTTAIMDYGSMIYLALQRAKTARQAIKVMTDLVRDYGYYSGGESFTIADPNEAWIMEMIGKGPGVRGAVWVAVRIPDDCIAAHANQSRIHQFNMNDPENCLYASDVVSFAREKGYFNGKNKDFSFADAYNPLDFGGLRYCEARVWSYYNMFTDRGAEFLPYIQGTDPTPMPLYLKPNRKVSVRDIQKAMRDHYEGTALDITQDVGAGAYHTPYRLSPLSFSVDGQGFFNERPISTQQSAWVFVSQMRADKVNEVGGILWFGNDDANMTVFTPVYCCTDEVPECYSGPEGADYAKFSWKSAFWIYNWVANMVYPRYDLMIGDVRKVQDGLEDGYANRQAEVEAEAMRLYKTDPAAARKYLTNYTVTCAQDAVAAWKQLGEYIIVKYVDGVVHREKDGQFERNSDGEALIVRPGFPEAFKKEIARQTGDRYKKPAENK